MGLRNKILAICDRARILKGAHGKALERDQWYTQYESLCNSRTSLVMDFFYSYVQRCAKISQTYNLTCVGAEGGFAREEGKRL